MILRELPPTEWDALKGTDLGQALAVLPSAAGRVLVVEDEGQIVGCWGLFLMLHAEGVWIAPEHRGKTSVARRLWQGMRDLVRSTGQRDVITGAEVSDSIVTELLRAHGAVELPPCYRLSW